MCDVNFFPTFLCGLGSREPKGEREREREYTSTTVWPQQLAFPRTDRSVPYRAFLHFIRYIHYIILNFLEESTTIKFIYSLSCQQPESHRQHPLQSCKVGMHVQNRKVCVRQVNPAPSFYCVCMNSLASHLCGPSSACSKLKQEFWFLNWKKKRSLKPCFMSHREFSRSIESIKGR